MTELTPSIFRTYKVCLLVKSSPGYLDPETLVENCAPKFSIEKAVPYKPLLAETVATPLPSSAKVVNQPPEEEEYSYSDSDYTHLYKKLANTYEDEVMEAAGEQIYSQLKRKKKEGIG